MNLGTELWIRIVVSALLLIFPLSLVIQKIINSIKKNAKRTKKVTQITAPKAGHVTKDVEIANGKKKYQVEAMIITKEEVKEQPKIPEITRQVFVETKEEKKVEEKTNLKAETKKPPSLTTQTVTKKTTPEVTSVKKVAETRNIELEKRVEALKDEARRLEERNPSGYEKKLIEGLSLAPENTELLTMLTDHYFQADEHKKALSLLKKLLDQQKDNHKALRQMGEIYLKQGDIQTAEIMIEKAVKKSSENPKYLYSLVDIKYNTNNIDDAIYLVERILKLRPTNVEYLTAAAMLYEKQGDTINAKKRYFEVLQYDPENRVAKKKLIQYK